MKLLTGTGQKSWLLIPFFMLARVNSLLQIADVGFLTT
jgi:hypothetical protein